jgi:hypothetical protein
MSEPSAEDPSSLIDLHRYPIGDPSLMAPIISAAHRDLAGRGVVVLDGFLRPDAVTAMCAECEALDASAHFAETFGTPYLGPAETGVPVDDPRGAQLRSALSAVAYDLFPPSSLLRALYEWEPMLEVVSALLGRAPLYRYADRLGALNIASMSHGDELGWHFDMTDFVVSIALQSSESGGDFEAVTRIRSADDERHEVVGSVLGGSRLGVEHIAMRPGALMLFEGRHSMHRVTPIAGTRSRYVALLAYDTQPDTDSSELLKLVRYGRLPS